MWQVSDLRAFLSGGWQLDRTLFDRRHSISGTLNGRATFTPAGDSLFYEERGMLTFGTHQGPAEQRLVFDFRSGPAPATVSFRDGRTFHELDLSQGEAIVSHLCGPDVYQGVFSAISATLWRSTWKVTGPRKDQEIVTLYSRHR